MTSYHHIYACCWVRRDFFLLWQMVANKWPGLQWFFLVYFKNAHYFFHMKLECSSKRRNEMTENSNAYLFPFIEYWTSTSQRDPLYQEENLLIWNNMYLSKNISLNCSTNVLYYNLMVKEFCLIHAHFQSANQERYPNCKYPLQSWLFKCEERNSTRNLDTYKL